MMGIYKRGGKWNGHVLEMCPMVCNLQTQLQSELVHLTPYTMLRSKVEKSSSWRPACLIGVIVAQ
jgi:hypothetical protein